MIKLKEDYDAAHNLLGIVYAGMGNKEQAVKSINEAIKLNPKKEEYQ